jgi:hypothetical protein
LDDGKPIWPDHDPVASGSGARYRSIVPAPIPIPSSADVPEVVLQRHDDGGRMRVTACYSTGRTQTGLLRGLDGDERRIVISCPWGQDPARTVAAIWDQLTPAEQVEVAEAFGLGQQQP